MPNHLPADLSDAHAAESRTDEPATGSTPVELDLSVLKHVAGGGPNGTWSPAAASTDGPNGNWM